MTTATTDKPMLFHEREMNAIYDSLDWNLYDHLRQADSIIRTMFTEMSLIGAGADKAVPFLQNKFIEIMQRIAEEASQENKMRGRGKSIEDVM